MRGGDGVDRHEADVVPVARVAGARVAETDHELHGARTWREGAGSGGRVTLLSVWALALAGGKKNAPRAGPGAFLSSTKRGRDQPSAAAASSPPSPSSERRPDGAWIEAMAKSRSVIVGRGAGGQRHHRDVDGVVDVGAGEVDDDLLRDVAGGDHQLDLGTHLGQDAAALQARGLVAVDVLDGDVERDPRLLAEAEEVDVGRQVLDDVALHAAADDVVVLAVDLDVDQRRQEAAGLQLLQERVELDVDRSRALRRRRR